MTTEHDGIERTEAPTPRWVAHVRERKAWPSSRELVTACSVLSGVLMLRYAGPSLIARLHSMLSNDLETAAVLHNVSDIAAARVRLLANSWGFMQLLLPPVVVALFVGLLQTAGRFRADLLRPRLERFGGAY